MQLSEKEKKFLEDQKKHEEICIQKYNEYAGKASDPKLKQMFLDHSSHEQKHFDTIQNFVQGQQSGGGTQGGGQGSQSQQGGRTGGTQTGGTSGTTGGQTTNSVNCDGMDEYMCNDMLMTEKYVSGTYDTAIFEASSPEVRQTLQHIQKEEQQHGADIFNYMQQNGMYKVK